jgi:actin-like protein 6A
VSVRAARALAICRTSVARSLTVWCAVRDFDLVERLWDHGLRDRLRVDPSEHPLLHAEAPHSDASTRQRLTERVFESLRVPAFYLAKDPVLSCFATGRDKGLVIDSGGDCSVASCVHDGFSLRKSVVVSALGGSSLSSDLLAHVQQQLGVAVRPRFDVRRTEVKPGEFTVQQLNLPARDSYRRAMVFDVARDIKESLCRVSEQPWRDVANHGVAGGSYELPDGNKIELAAPKFALAEPLFAAVPDGAAPIGADTLDAQNLSVPQIAVASLRRADVDLQRDLFANVVATGGNSMLPGFSERLTHELASACAPQMFKLKLIAAGFAAERRFSVWIGGSILASLGTFQQLWISKQEYDETGAQIVQIKCA